MTRKWSCTIVVWVIEIEVGDGEVKTSISLPSSGYLYSYTWKYESVWFDKPKQTITLALRYVGTGIASPHIAVAGFTMRERLRQSYKTMALKETNSWQMILLFRSQTKVRCYHKHDWVMMSSLRYPWSRRGKTLYGIINQVTATSNASKRHRRPRKMGCEI